MSLPTLLLTGCNGQLGRTFSDRWTKSNLNGRFQLVKASRAILDRSDTDSTASYLTSINPSLIVNAAAYTRVDEAESDSESAYLVNDIAVGILVSWCQKNSCKLIHLSTDFVFDGLASVPYKTDAITNPLGVYGLSKLGGEQRVLHGLPTKGFVVRTSWLYSEYAPNFVKTMLRLMSGGRDIRVINDQIGSPTSAHSLVEFIYYSCVEDSSQSYNTGEISLINSHSLSMIMSSWIVGYFMKTARDISRMIHFISRIHLL